MSQFPTISIIVPVYKAEKYLNDCLDSILTQTFSNFELILVDDGSPDNSGAICDLYALKDPRIKVIHKFNGGASTARQAGLTIAKGRYIGWVDADDRIAPDMYSVLYDLAVNYNADIAECQYIMIDGERSIRSGNEEPVVYVKGDLILGEFFNSRMKPSFCTKLYRSELFNDIHFPDRQLHVDFYVNLLFALKPLNYVRTPETLYYYIVREQSNITTHNARAIREALYKYDYTVNIAESVESELARKYLLRDSISRLLRRYFEISVNSNLKDQNVYNYLIRKKLGLGLIKYLLFGGLPVKTRISYALLLSNMKNIQRVVHLHLGSKPLLD